MWWCAAVEAERERRKIDEILEMVENRQSVKDCATSSTQNHVVFLQREAAAVAAAANEPRASEL